MAQALYRQETTWPEATLNLRDYYRSRDEKEHLRLSLILADAFPFLPELQRDAAVLLLRADRVREALNYAHRAATRTPRDVSTLMALAETFARLGMKREAEQVLDRVLSIDAGNSRAERAKLMLQLDGDS